MDILTCGTDWVIYLIYCHICRIQYVGRTTQKLRQRMNQHRYDIRALNGTALHTHFNIYNHGLQNLRIIPIEKVWNLTNAEFAACEQFWMDRLNTLVPNGLNMRRAVARGW